MGKKNDNTLVKNASFLMVAALISKIIGMLYKSPLSTTLGSQSFALFQFAQNVYFILLMIASFSIPQAVSKIMAEKIAFHRYKDAQKVFYGALIYAAVAGGIVVQGSWFRTVWLTPVWHCRCLRPQFSCPVSAVYSVDISRHTAI